MRPPLDGYRGYERRAPRDAPDSEASRIQKLYRSHLPFVVSKASGRLVAAHVEVVLMRAQIAWTTLIIGLTLSAAVGCGTDRTGLQPSYQPVQPERSDGPSSPQPVRPGATPPPVTPATDAATPVIDATAPAIDAARPTDPPAPREPAPEPTRPTDGNTPLPACDDQLTACGRTDGGAPACVSLANDEDNCGACGRRCSGDQACVAGACGCGQGQTSCGGLCVNLQADPAHCGACNRPCLPGQFCTQGRCSLLCDAGLSICGGACVDLQANPRHCGSCNNVCKGNRPCMRGMCSDKGGGGPGPN
jgi:hypothetical protein